MRAQTVCLASVMFGSGAALGAAASSVSARREQAPAAAPSDYSRYQKLDIFARALAIIEQYYVRPVDDVALVHAAIRGLVSELDPHSEYLAPREAQLLREDIDGVFGGIGMTVTLGRDQGRLYLLVRELVHGGPAERAGVKPEQRIVAIDERPIARFLDLREAIMAIRGRPGTTVKLTIEDPERSTLRAITLTRQHVDPPAVDVEYAGDGFGVVKLSDFTEGSAREINQGLATLRKRSAPGVLRGIVLDLRNNGGGLLHEAVAIANRFLDEGVIVRTRGRRGELIDEVHARQAGTERELPLVVLVNEASASASEIVAGALQDRRRALVVGERTFGKGSVQSPFELGDGSLLKLTTALYYTPADRIIQASGVIPDVYVRASGRTSASASDERSLVGSEREHPRHLRPEDFGGAPSSQPLESPVLAFAGDDVQLRTALSHLQSLARVKQP